jgi:hypothetical protein
MPIKFGFWEWALCFAGALAFATVGASVIISLYMSIGAGVFGHIAAAIAFEVYDRL